MKTHTVPLGSEFPYDELLVVDITYSKLEVDIAKTGRFEDWRN